MSLSRSIRRSSAREPGRKWRGSSARRKPSFAITDWLRAMYPDGEDLAWHSTRRNVFIAAAQGERVNGVRMAYEVETDPGPLDNFDRRHEPQYAYNYDPGGDGPFGSYYPADGPYWAGADLTHAWDGTETV